MSCWPEAGELLVDWDGLDDWCSVVGGEQMNFLYLQLITKQQQLSGSEQIILKWWQRGCLSQWPFNRTNLFLLYVLLNWWAASNELLTLYGLFFQRNGQYHKHRLNSLSNRTGKYATLSCGCRANTVLQWCRCVAVTSNTSDDERKGFLILLHARLVAILSRLFLCLTLEELRCDARMLVK